jgi:alkylated DNA repair dioxygenase AlkB
MTTAPLPLEAVARLPLPDAELAHWPGFLPASAAQDLFRELEITAPWEQTQIRIAGRPLAIPRLNVWYGDPGTNYGYSGARLASHPWTPALAALRSQVETITGHRFNSALLNCYRSGRDSVDWHSDDEAVLGPEPVIATLSLGVARRFEMRHRSQAGLRRQLVLESGSLLLMAGSMQRHWRHRVPKEPAVEGARISITLRLVRSVREWTAIRSMVRDPGGC